MGSKFTKKEDIKKEYELRNVLGIGTFAKVKRAVRRSDGRVFAVKTIKKDKLDPDELRVMYDEVKILKKVNHPHCVRLYEVFDNHNKLHLVMDLVPGGELFDNIVRTGSFSEKRAGRIVKQVASALKYLHDVGIVHRDIKPENILCVSKDAKSDVKLTDFGLSKYIFDSDTILKTKCGTPSYVAPDILNAKHGHYTQAVDMWSLGVVMYIMLCGYPPFYSDYGNSDLYRKIRQGKVQFDPRYWGRISEQAKDLILGLLTVDPTKRLTAEQVLKHPWILSNNRSSLVLERNIKELGAHIYRARMRVGVRAIVAVGRFKRGIFK